MDLPFVKVEIPELIGREAYFGRVYETLAPVSSPAL